MRQCFLSELFIRNIFIRVEKKVVTLPILRTEPDGALLWYCWTCGDPPTVWSSLTLYGPARTTAAMEVNMEEVPSTHVKRFYELTNIDQTVKQGAGENERWRLDIS